MLGTSPASTAHEYVIQSLHTANDLHCDVVLRIFNVTLRVVYPVQNEKSS